MRRALSALAVLIGVDHARSPPSRDKARPYVEEPFGQTADGTPRSPPTP